MGLVRKTLALVKGNTYRMVQQVTTEDMTTDLGKEMVDFDIGLSNPEDVVGMSDDRKDMEATLTAAATMDLGNPNKAEEFLSKKQQAGAYITNGSSESLRTAMAIEQGQDAVQVLDEVATQILSTPTQSPEDLAFLKSYHELSQEAIIQENYDALEARALENIAMMATEHPEYLSSVELMLKDEKMGEASDWIRDQLERTLIIQREAEKIAEQSADDFILSTVVNYLAMLVPTNFITASDDLPGSEFWSMSGSNIGRTSDTLMGMSREEFNAVYPQVIQTIKNQSGYITENPVIAQDLVNKLAGVSHRDRRLADVFDVVDIAALLPVTTGVKLSKAAVLRATSKPTAADVTEATLQASKTADTQLATDAVGSVDEAVESLMPSALVPTNVVNGPGIGEAVARKLEVQKEVISNLRRDFLEGSPEVPRLTEDEMELAYEATLEQLGLRFGKAVTDFHTPQQLKDGIPMRNNVGKLTYLLGRKDGHGFAREQDAKAALSTRFSNVGDGVTYQDPTSQLWFVRGEMDVSEKNFASMKYTDVTDGTVLGAWVRSAASILPEYMQKRAVAANFNVSALHKSLQPVLDDIGGLNAKSRRAIESVWVRGRDVDNKWYNPTEFQSNFRQLNGRVPSDKETLAYYSMKNLNDAEYYLRNHAEYVRKTSEGFITGKLDSPSLSFGYQNMKKIDKPYDMRQTTVYNTQTDELISGADIVPSDLERMLTDGHELFRLESTKLRIDGAPVQYILARQGNMVTKPLEYRQLNYAAGGHRIYEGTVFVKQGVVGSIVNRAGQTRKYIENAKTHAVFPTAGAANKYIVRMENARLAFREYSVADDATKEVLRDATDSALKQAGFEDGIDEYAMLIAKGKVIPDQPFELIRGSESPRIYKEIRDGDDNLIDMQVINDGRPDWLEDHGMLYYSKRGHALNGPQDELAQTIDPFATANRAVENAMDTAGYLSYKINAVQRWLNEFGSIMTKDEGLSDLQRFWKSNLREDAPQDLRRAAERSRIALQNQLGHPTKYGSTLQESIVKMADWVEGFVPGKVGSSTAKGLLNLQSKDPIAALKALSFDSKLGLFDPSQILVQTQTAFAMMTIDPLNAPRFFRDAAALRWAAINTSDEIMNAAAKMSSMEPAEFKAMTEGLRRSGAAHPGGEMVLTDHYGGINASIVGHGAAKVRSKGRMFFYEAERLNRIYGWRKAWNDLRDKGMTVEELSKPEGRASLSNLTDQYTINMVSASAAGWQRGIFAVPTQFLSYQARFMENVLPKAFGGNPQWTSGQKLRMVLGQMFLYGAAGVPAGRAMAEYGKSTLGLEFEEDSMVDSVAHRAILGGIFDSTIYAVTAGTVDVAFGDRAAIFGKGLEDLIATLNGSGPGDTSFLDVIAGAPFGVLGDYGSDFTNGLMEIFHASMSETASVTDVLPDMVSDIADNISTLSRVQRAYWVLRYGEWISQETGKTITKATPAEAIAAALGIQPRDIAEVDYMRNILDQDKDQIKAVAKRVKQLQLEAWRAHSQGDKDTFARKLRIVTAITQPYDTRTRHKILEAGSKTPQYRDQVEYMRSSVMRQFGAQPLRNQPERNTQ